MSSGSGPNSGKPAASAPVGADAARACTPEPGLGLSCPAGLVRSLGWLPRPARTFAVNVRQAWRWRKPWLLLRLARRVIEARVLGQIPLRYLEFSITSKCNLQCPHCFATAFPAPLPAERLTAAEYRRVAVEAMALGAVNFSFQGGEPLLEPRLAEIVTACQPRANLISVTTNGTLLEPRRLAALRRIGVDILTVSVDSGDPAEHDAFRGRAGLFATIVEGIRAAGRVGLKVTLGATVSRGNYGTAGLEKLMAFAEQEGLVLVLGLAAPIGRWRGRDDVVLSAEQVSAIRARCAASTFIRTDFDVNFGARGCGAVKEILYIDQRGEVLPCPFIHISLGNVRTRPLAMIRRDALGIRWFTGYAPRCLCGEDSEFVSSVLGPAARLPAPVAPEFWQR